MSSTGSPQLEELRLMTSFKRRRYTHTITDLEEPTITRCETWTRIKTLGKGSEGTVYKETCVERRGTSRAVKQIQKSPTGVRWNEITILAQLRSYPEHFVQLTGWFEDEKNIYLAMEYLPGNLGTLLNNQNLSEDDTKRVTKQILMGLDIMHQKRICHRDLKPSNILIAQWVPITVKIADFGLSKDFDYTECRSTIGTQPFMAPEIWGFGNEETSVYTTAVDIWSLGCLVYFMMTKALPFPETGNLMNFVQGRALFPLIARTAWTIRPSALAVELITSLLQPLPQDRPPASEAQLHSWLLFQDPPRDLIISQSPSGDPALASAKRKLPPLDTLGPNKQPRISRLEVRGMLPLLEAGGPKKQHRTTIGIRKRESIQYLLVAAAASGNCEALIEALEKGARPMENPSPSGYTPIYIAAKNGHLPIIKLLLKHGAHLDVEGERQLSALHGAVMGGNLQVVQYLLQRGADLSAKEKDGYTALHIAAQFGPIDVLKLLIDRGAAISVRTGGTIGWTALLLAAYKGRLDSLRYLLERGADISAKRLDNGGNALHLAAEVNHPKVVGLLLEKGADLSAKEKDGYTALHVAAQFGSIDVLKLLIDRGADISVRTGDTEGWTALLLAAYKGHLDNVRYLLERGADISAKRLDNGGNALHLAVMEGYLNMARLLLERGASTTSKTDQGETALSLAATGGDIDTVRLIIEWSERDEDTSMASDSTTEPPGSLISIPLQNLNPTPIL